MRGEVLARHFEQYAAQERAGSATTASTTDASTLTAGKLQDIYAEMATYVGPPLGRDPLSELGLGKFATLCELA